MGTEKSYELVVIIDPEEDSRAVLSDVKAALEELEFSVKDTEVWGLRTLSYPINKQDRGRYVQFKIATEESGNIQQLRQELKIKEEILRTSVKRLKN